MTPEELHAGITGNNVLGLIMILEGRLEIAGQILAAQMAGRPALLLSAVDDIAVRYRVETGIEPEAP